MRWLTWLQSILNRRTLGGLLAAVSVLQGSLPAAPAPANTPGRPEATAEADDFQRLNDTVYPLGDINLRSGPATMYEAVAVIPKGEPLRRIGSGSDGWSLVRYMDVEGYVPNGLVTTERPAESVPEPSADGYLHASYGQELLHRINVHRQENGLHALAGSAVKQSAADEAAREIARDGFDLQDLDSVFGLDYPTPEACLQAWILSPAFNAMLLSPLSTTGAAACFVDSQGRLSWAFRN